jgi:hypothetical protein
LEFSLNLYSNFLGEWSKPMGTDLVFKSTTLPLPLGENENEKEYEFVSCSRTRLSANKAIMSKMSEEKQEEKQE